MMASSEHFEVKNLIQKETESEGNNSELRSLKLEYKGRRENFASIMEEDEGRDSRCCQIFIGVSSSVWAGLVNDVVIKLIWASNLAHIRWANVIYFFPFDPVEILMGLHSYSINGQT